MTLCEKNVAAEGKTCRAETFPFVRLLSQPQQGLQSLRASVTGTSSASLVPSAAKPRSDRKRDAVASFSSSS